MSSRSPTPTPPSSNHKSGSETSGGTLSKDALYAPLSIYATTTPSKTKSSHSLSLQTKSTLPSLITSLTSMSANLKTSHPHEYQLYRGMGGSIARFGMGDNDRANNSMRGLLEGKLLNRSLVLVGGGVHSTHTTSASSRSVEKNDGVVGLGMAQVASSGKRERKRVGGNGIFGSVSNKKRKKILRQIREKQSKKNVDLDLKIHDGDGEVASSAQEEQPKNKKVDDGTPTDTEATVGSIIETLHEMWVNYMHQLLSPIKEANNIATTSTDDSPSLTLTLEDHKQISIVLATAEHVGMPATIVECPSRRHLTQVRCIVVNETKETWKIAMIIVKNKKKDGKPKEKGESEKNVDGKTSSAPSSHLWKIVMVPKRGTVLDVDLPWGGSFVSKDDSTVPEQLKNTYITVRLETT
mmetsp:Transcript_1261/g.2273  ORF Transcript_1261/g.2273 Transcript_1261/m.2273 type:complete len:409 (+) Transcript_1261:254-1480(+)